MFFGSAEKEKKTTHFATDVKQNDGESTPLLDTFANSLSKDPKDPQFRRADFQGSQTGSFRRKRRSSLKTGQLIPPSAALVSLINGESLPPEAMTVKDPHPHPRIKSMPAVAPYTRKSRHRSFYLRWVK